MRGLSVTQAKIDSENRANPFFTLTSQTRNALDWRASHFLFET
ncbi:hypothetical protein MATR_17710 [Marivirga tractuosa]|uniref:Uncharacterized protein n=1 Tax=Marivirga tractuosa (strain ATCC 23168 / DSM 4126 / NBRC 15989 / NCIMB 1408 / VKM B-1430 / H-43) TaxID=643867 RepID=E4TQP3_MARTH|nr:hypothetical protein Ftrac_0602 [Marivirga tractuosa DSM 4126]BDD14946.1 hypothetical protein MATR_17710 [Marivirga tractuosa]